MLAAANLRAAVYGLKQCRDRAYVTKVASGVAVPEFTPKSGVRIETTDAELQARNDGGFGKCGPLP